MKMQTKIYQLLYTFSVEYLRGEHLNYNHVAPSVELMMQL